MIVFDDLMTEAFGNKDNESTMNLITTKLSHHNNLSVLIVCHELYPKGKSSVLFREQLTGVHLHAIANQQRIRSLITMVLTWILLVRSSIYPESGHYVQPHQHPTMVSQFGCLRTLLDRDADEVNDECGDNDNDDEDAEDGDYLVQQRSGDLIGGGSKQPHRAPRHPI